MSSLASLMNATVLASIATPALKSGHSAAQKANMAAFGEMLPDLLERFDVVTPLRISHFLAQVTHESDAFKTLEEYASGAAYEGRKDLGNTQPGDGKRFKGRGPIQLTGRANHRNFTLWLRSLGVDCPDFEVRPELVATFPWAGWAAIWFWSTRKLNVLAERDDLVAVTKVVNGGRNGLADRAENLTKAKSVIAKIEASRIAAHQDNEQPLYRGCKGERVGILQAALNKAGPYALVVDEAYGPATELAVKAFQKTCGLTVDGIAGRATFALLAPFIAEG